MQRHQLMVPIIEYAPCPGQREICFPAGSLNHLQRAAIQGKSSPETSREVQP